MARHYIIQDWQNAAEYSGEMIGNRLASSEQLYLSNGKANTALFADPPAAKRKQLSAFEKACSADRAFERLEKLSLQLDDEYAAEKISSEDWVYARKQLDGKLERAWAKVCKLRGWNASEYASATSVQGKESTLCFATKKPTNNSNSIDVYSGQRSVFEELSDDNIFKRAYLLIKQLKRG